MDTASNSGGGKREKVLVGSPFAAPPLSSSHATASTTEAVARDEENLRDDVKKQESQAADAEKMKRERETVKNNLLAKRAEMERLQEDEERAKLIERREQAMIREKRAREAIHRLDAEIKELKAGLSSTAKKLHLDPDDSVPRTVKPKPRPMGQGMGGAGWGPHHEPLPDAEEEDDDDGDVTQVVEDGSYACLTCGRQFATERGVNTHCAKQAPKHVWRQPSPTKGA